MRKRLLTVLAAGLALASAIVQGAELTATESTWLEAARPVLAFARAQGLPLRIMVQPQDTRGETPIGMAFIEGRCVLVLSMRGNPEAQALLDTIGRGLLGPVVEAMAAHELAHCWRHDSRAWGTMPSGLMEISGFSHGPDEQAGLLEDARRTRREEGFADLVSLAWTLQRNPDRYEDVHAWYVLQRATAAVQNGPHDTRAWIQLAADKAAFKPAASIFEQVETLWRAGLLEDF